MPAVAESELYIRCERLLEIHYNALIVPDSDRARKGIGNNRHAYRLWRTEDAEQVTLRGRFCEQVFEALEGAVITQGYFRRELPFGYCRDIWGSWFNDKAEVDSKAATTYGIVIAKRRFGVFDGTFGPLAEARYLVEEVPWKKTVGAFMAVAPDEWLRYAIEVGIPIEAVKKELEAKRNVKVKGK